MYQIVKFFLFKLNPEKAHHFTAKMLHLFIAFPVTRFFWKKTYCIEHPSLEREIAGLKFKNPVGLGAGFDKDATMFEDLAYCGFGFIEIGTVTPKAQDGNPQPRLFRLVEDAGIINRMGFNNKGVDAAVLRLKNKKTSCIIGGNIGKNKVTANEDATQDYVISFQKLFPYVDYFVVNVSSPNTPNLRDLQEKEPLKELLSTLMKENGQQAVQKPIFLKIAPDLTESQLDDIVEIVNDTQIAGVIATNTTISRENLKTDSKIIEEIGAGGLSGKPVKNKSTEVIRYLSKASNKAFPIIGIGGIHSVEDALEKLEAGADLIQLYTGFIYEGPQLIKRINQALIKQSSKK
jgi:dihydroorotate dehydrogenase